MNDNGFHITVYIASDVVRPSEFSGDAHYYIRAEKGDRTVKEQGYHASFDATTRNRSYMDAALLALGRMNAAAEGSQMDIIFDYKYMVMEFEAMRGRAPGFLRKDGKELRNADLWKRLYESLRPYDVELPDGRRRRWRCSYMAREDMARETGGWLAQVKDPQEDGFMLTPRSIREIEEIKIRVRAADAAGMHIRDAMQSTGIPGATDWKKVAQEAKELAVFAEYIAGAVGRGNEAYKEEDDAAVKEHLRNRCGEDRAASGQPEEGSWGLIGAYGFGEGKRDTAGHYGHAGMRPDGAEGGSGRQCRRPA